jgi:quinone-modifying oxidoreductase subunit QmoC
LFAREAVKHYAVPGFPGDGSVREYRAVVASAVLLVLALVLRGPTWPGVLRPTTVLCDLFPHWLLIGFYFFWGLAMAGVWGGRYWQAMKAADRIAGRELPSTGIMSSWVRTIKSILAHDRFSKCSSQASRRTTHLGAFYGFLALFLVSAWAVVALYMINPLIPGHERDLVYPFAIWNPWKILANLGGVALVVGSVLAIRERRSGEKDAPTSSSFDWLFLSLLLIVGATGLLTEILRYVVEPSKVEGMKYATYAVYFVHLVAVFDLLVYLPYSKLAHVVYRTVALVYAEHSGRNQKILEPGT